MSFISFNTYPNTSGTTFTNTSYTISSSSPIARVMIEREAAVERAKKALESWIITSRSTQPKLSSLAHKTPFHFTIGIELTFVPEVFDKAMDSCTNHRRWAELAMLYKSVVDPLMLGNTEAVHADPGCVEYPSPILESWAYTHTWYRVACLIAKELGLVPEHEDQEGGMGHIHIGLDNTQIAHIHADLLTKPYLTWIFATPNGSQYCKSLARAYINEHYEPRFPMKESEFAKVGRRQRGNSNVFDTTMSWESFDHNGEPYSQDLSYSEQYGNNLHALTADRFSIAPHNSFHSTMEWRAFDAAATWREQEEHIAFLQRYCYKVLSRADSYPSIPFGPGLGRTQRNKTLKSFIDAYRNDKDACVRDFKELIVNTLELPWNRYEWYLERNLDPAFEWGKRY